MLSNSVSFYDQKHSEKINCSERLDTSAFFQFARKFCCASLCLGAVYKPDKAYNFSENKNLTGQLNWSRDSVF